MEWPVRMRGDEGPSVRTLQYLLRSHGAELAPDGQFGEATEAAVAGFQKARELPANGVAGGETWEALIVDLDIGSTGDAVKAAQTQLYVRGTLPSVDGIYSMKMNISVRRYQVLKHLSSDGIVDENTWRALMDDSDLPSISQELSREGFDWQAKLKSMLRPEG